MCVISSFGGLLPPFVNKHLYDEPMIYMKDGKKQMKHAPETGPYPHILVHHGWWLFLFQTVQFIASTLHTVQHVKDNF